MLYVFVMRKKTFPLWWIILENAIWPFATWETHTIPKIFGFNYHES